MFWIGMMGVALAGGPADGDPFAVFEPHDDWATLTTREVEGVEVEVRHRWFDEIGCFEGRTRTDVEPDVMLAITTDVSNAPRWSAAPLLRSEILARPSAGVMHYVQLVDVPDWTLAHDRYWVLRGDFGRRPDGARRFRWTRLDAAEVYPSVYAELTDTLGAIEVPVNWGEWLFFEADGGVEVRYRVCTEAGGALPAWVQKMATRRTLPDVVGHLVAEGRRRRAASTADARR